MVQTGLSSLMQHVLRIPYRSRGSRAEELQYPSDAVCSNRVLVFELNLI